MTTDNPRLRTCVLAGGVLAALVAVTGCGGSADDKDGPAKRDFSLAGDQLTISRNKGDLKVRSADVDKVEVTRWFSGWSAVGGKPKASWELVDDKLTLNTDCGGLISNCSARYEVLVPRRVALAVEGDNGKTTAAGFQKALRIRSDNGSVSVSGTSGDLTLESGSGAVKATGVSAGRVKASTDNGKVDLSFATAPDEVDVTTENGGVTVQVPDTTYKVVTKTENGSVKAGVPTDANSPHVISARTENGAITLRTVD
ncbi:lipoprotein [Streptomyces hygroscopicus subsp. sporocinereus]|uniref:Lipoprotein n=1 Tax=Streptomyces hygroscopicus TaxID=1912 RepID=A0ABQ3TQJ9_STRHY|nr:DUF4097 family beta strand repeat-containing protein [Streptomyces hygroscopicus]GHJ25617.1 lipoprotein [Streptomyces hygroscopicus]